MNELIGTKIKATYSGNEYELVASNKGNDFALMENRSQDGIPFESSKYTKQQFDRWVDGGEWKIIKQPS